MSIPARGRASRLVLVVTALIATLSCSKSKPEHPVKPAPVAASFTGGLIVASGSVDSAKVDSILQIVATKANEFPLGHGRTDVRRLIVGACTGGTCSAGPLIRAIPHKDSHRGDSATLAKGKVVAKLVTVANSANQGVYAKFAIAAGDSAYEYIELTTVGTTKMLRSIFVPSKLSNWRMAQWRQTHIYRVNAEPHPRSRFLWNDNDDEKWNTCMSGGCCAPPGYAIFEL